MIMKLKIGARDKLKGYTHLDIDPTTRPDITADCRKMKMIKTGSVSEIVCEHVIEHINNPMEAIREFHRVLVRGGTLKIIIPHALNPDFHGTPDHYAGWTYATPSQFWQYEHRYPKFSVSKRRIIMKFRGFQFLADRWPLLVERFYFILQPDYIECEMKAMKN